jgi:hypothetical protein
MRHCRPRANDPRYAELDALERQRTAVEAHIARLEMALELMAEGEWRLERESVSGTERA